MDKLVTLLHLPGMHDLHLNFPTSSWYSPGIHESHVVTVLGLVVIKPARHLSHRNESSFAVIFFAVEELKNVPGKQQKDKPLLPLKEALPMGAFAQILLHQVWLNFTAPKNTSGERKKEGNKKEGWWREEICLLGERNIKKVRRKKKR